MILSGYGVKLVRLTRNDIELVRQKRNSENISRFMEFREIITPEMQEKWFASVNNPYNHYYIIISNEQKSGLINGSKVDWEKKETGSGGIFIWDENLWETPAPLAASLLLTDTSVALGLERTYIKVLRDNPNAIRYNLQLGYELLPGQEEAYNQEYVLHQKNYLEKTKKIRPYFYKQFGETIDVIVDDPENSSTKFLLERISAADPERRKKLNVILPEKV